VSGIAETAISERKDTRNDENHAKDLHWSSQFTSILRRNQGVAGKKNWLKEYGEITSGKKGQTQKAGGALGRRRQGSLGP
jgi:hypothetical protein